jgi:hypothetical protein
MDRSSRKTRATLNSEKRSSTRPGAPAFTIYGHRHWYAQWRYKVLTGRPSPAAGGETCERLSHPERASDYRARMQISRELGHNRLQITDTYLGSRFAKKGRTS